MEEIADSLLEELRFTYGKIAKVGYTRPGRDPEYVIVRKPKFDEYLFFNKYTTVTGKIGDQLEFELDPEVTDYFFSKVLVYPENADITNVPVGTILKACNVAIELSDFEDPTAIRDMYIKSIKSINSQPGAMITKIVGAFGIQGYLAAKHLAEEEIIDLLAMIETITNTVGDFGKITALPGLPYTKQGKLDVGKLIGLDSDDAQVDKAASLTSEKKEWLHNYYKGLNYTEEQIAKQISMLENSGKQFDDRPPIDNDGKMDMGRMTDKEIQNLSAAEYSRLKKEGKILSNEESQSRSWGDAKTALDATIQQDRQAYGEQNNKPKPNYLGGDMKDLLTEISNITRQIGED